MDESYVTFTEIVFIQSILIPLIGEGNGSPLQCSCLENPVDRGAWWAAVHRVAQNWTRLKWLSMHVCIGKRNGKPLQYSCLENPTDREAWQAVHGVAKSRTWLRDLACTHAIQWQDLPVHCNICNSYLLLNRHLTIIQCLRYMTGNNFIKIWKHLYQYSYLSE